MSTRVAAILLAAGRSLRMGRCKQLLPLGGMTAIGRCLAALRDAGIGEIVAVVSPEGDAVAAEAGKQMARVAVNDDPDGDMASSVRVGRDAVTAGVTGVVVALCDSPLVRPATVAHLLRQHDEHPGLILVPAHSQRRGHPVLVPRPLLDELQPGNSLRDVIRRDAARVRLVDVDDPGILFDMDTPADYRRAAASWGQAP